MTIHLIEERCKPCLLCVRDCLVGAWREINGRPVMAAPELCINCSHCVSVCPRSAIVHEALDPQQIRSINRALLVPEAYHEIVRGRRSVRQYRKQAVPQEVIEDILDLASHSPSASNLQNVGYTVITDKALLGEISSRVFDMGRRFYNRTQQGAGKWIHRFFQKISPAKGSNRYLDSMTHYISESDKGRDYVLHDAPVLILVHGPRKGPFLSENCNIAATNIMNYAHAKGLGSCYIGFLCLALKFSWILRKKVKLARGRKVYACLVMGYPAYRYRSTASRKKPAVHWIGSS